VIQSNATFGMTCSLEVHLSHVRMPAGNGGVKTKGRSLDVMSVIKGSIVRMKAAIKCLAYALVIAMARVNGNRKYQIHRHGTGLRYLLNISWRFPVLIYLKAEAFKNFDSFKSTYRTTNFVFDSLNTEWVVFSGNLLSTKKSHLLYDRDNRHYNVITNIKGVMAK